MIPDRSGFILYTINYTACVEFYKNVMQLPVMFDNEMLTCFQFGGSYLLVEIDDETAHLPDGQRVKTCLRLNVEDVKAVADRIKAHGIPVNYGEYDWGSIAKFHDPDGNLIGIKDSEKFEAKIANYNTEGN